MRSKFEKQRGFMIGRIEIKQQQVNQNSWMVL